MVAVNLWSGLRRFADGAAVVEVKAATIGEMLDGLVALHPGLGPAVAAGMSVAVDGQVITGGRPTPLRPEAEIYLLQRIKGG